MDTPAYDTHNLIAVPCMDNISVRFAESLLALDKHCAPVSFKPNSLVYDARNLMALYAIEQNYDNVLWIDSDMTFPPEAFTSLLGTMRTRNVPMVTGVYFKRHFPTAPVIYSELDEPVVIGGVPTRRITEYDNYPRHDIFPVRGCGFGFCVTSVKLLKQVWDKFGPAFTPYPWAGEDISFCHRVNLLGQTILCNSSVSCGHVGTLVYDENLFLSSKEGD